MSGEKPSTCPHIPSSGYRSSGNHIPCGQPVERAGLCERHAAQADRLTAGLREPT